MKALGEARRQVMNVVSGEPQFSTIKKHFIVLLTLDDQLIAMDTLNLG